MWESKMKILKIYLVLCLLPLGSVAAGLPDITRENLVDLLRQQDKPLRAFQVKYRLAQGKYSETGELVPDVIIDCEFGHDIRKGHRYLHEKWVSHSSGEKLEREYAYDGRKGTKLSLKQPDSRGLMFGTVMAKVPEMLDDQAIWKPEWAGYGFIREYGHDTLSSAIRNAKTVTVASEELDGRQVYKVDFVLTGEKEKFVDRTGKTRWFTKDGTFAAWFSPEKGFRIVKISELIRGDSVVSGSCTASDFRQVGLGLWFPYRLERSSANRGRGRVITVEDVAINEDATVTSRLKFPPNTGVTNEIWQVKYQVGGGLWSVRVGGLPKTSTPYLVIGLLLISGISLLIYCKCRRVRKLTKQ
jgi:hypothetical protein